MKEKVIGILRNKLVIGLAFLLLGIGLVIVPEAYIKAVVRIMGAVLVVTAVFRVILFIKSEKKTADIIGLIFTVIFALFGIFMIVYPSLVVRFIYVVFGLLLVTDGIGGLVYSVNMLRKVGLPWIPFAVISLIVIAMGIIIVLNPFETAEWLYRFIGISMAVSGICDIVAFFTKKSFR